MEFCFNEGESDKRKRFTALKCQKLMQEKLCEELVLSEKQITSYWIAYSNFNTAYYSINTAQNFLAYTTH